MMDAGAIMQAFTGKVGVDEKTCFTCYATRPNWLNDLQDCLEDAGISLEEFCRVQTHSIDTFDVSGSFFAVERGRLRLKDDLQCVSGFHIRAMLEKLQK